MALTAKKRRFVEEYLVDLNASAAAVRAGYSAASGKQIGSRLMQEADVATALSDTVPGPLSDAERVSARRNCGYPVYSPGAFGFEGWRFFQAYGALEYRLTNLAAEELVQLHTFMAQLARLETGILTAADNLDTASAAVWTRNPAEVRDRERLFDGWRRRLCGFLGVPLGPELSGHAAAGRIVV